MNIAQQPKTSASRRLTFIASLKHLSANAIYVCQPKRLRLTAPDRAPIDNGFLLSGPSALPAKHMFRHSSSSVIACPKDYSIE